LYRRGKNPERDKTQTEQQERRRRETDKLTDKMAKERENNDLTPRTKEQKTDQEQIRRKQKKTKSKERGTEQTREERDERGKRLNDVLEVSDDHVFKLLARDLAVAILEHNNSALDRQAYRTAQCTEDRITTQTSTQTRAVHSIPHHHTDQHTNQSSA
jgi:hypothetical protein